ncbi:MAG TPA: paraquat-inducible protein A, partial [Nitrospirota bacterium]|nr:paraquat-inducible protein A [Nitrospirota bacterium]
VYLFGRIEGHLPTRHLVPRCSMKLFNLILSLMIVLASAVLCQQLISLSLANQQDKADYAMLKHVRYGLFSVEEWKKQLTGIISAEINKLYLSKTTERELRKRLEDLLDTLIDKVYERIREANAKSAEGRFKQSFINMFIDLKEIKKGIPEYADALMRELTKTKTRKQVKTLLNRQLEQYFSETFDEQDMTRIDLILRRTGARNIEGAREKLAGNIATRNTLIVRESVLLLILPIALFSWSVLSRQPLSPARYVLLLLCLVILLTAGVTTPMIDIEAKLSRMGFVLMGHTVHFEDETLYFQSKSILDVFRIMITHKDLSMNFVGILLITFSIVFPLLKIVSLPAYYYDYRGARKNPVVGFFVVTAGKWSMADVMVVAIFMAYIGFSGIITSQLKQLSEATRGLDLVTTNGTALQPGYYLFLTYTMLALFFSGFLAGESVRGREAEGPVNG